MKAINDNHILKYQGTIAKVPAGTKSTIVVWHTIGTKKTITIRSTQYDQNGMGLLLGPSCFRPCLFCIG